MAAPVYLDNHATTRVDDRVLAAMLPYFTEHYGNAASKTHAYGWTAEAAVDLAREQVSALVGGQQNEIVFTSGATEANNLAILGAARAHAGRGRHVVTVATEHPSVLDPCRRLVRDGAELTVLPVRGDGLVDPEEVAAAVRDDTVLVSVMLANNEIGVVQPIAAIARAVKAASPRCLVHCDAAQGAATLALDAAAWGVDLLGLSAHKMYGPKGVGALWVRRRPRVALAPILEGGGHERGLRSGTLPVPLVVGFGVACELAAAEREQDGARIAALRDRLLAGLRARLEGVEVNGSLGERLAGNLNVSFAGVDAEALVMAARDIAVSVGSACASASGKASHVLEALALSEERVAGALRYGVGRFNGEADIDLAIDATASAVERLREASPTWKAARR